MLSSIVQIVPSAHWLVSSLFVAQSDMCTTGSKTVAEMRQSASYVLLAVSWDGVYERAYHWRPNYYILYSESVKSCRKAGLHCSN